MKEYAIYQMVQRGTVYVRRYLGKCQSEVNLSRVRGVGMFTNHCGVRYPNQWVRFSADKSARAMLPKLDLVDVDELGYCDFRVD